MISICMITRNEQVYLEECLKRCKQYPVEIVVVDTGSEDDSVTIAMRYTDKVFHFPWCDDFSAAKNYAVSKASNDQVIIVDSDEWIEELDVVQIEQQLTERPYAVGRLQCVNAYSLQGKRLQSRDWLKRIYDRRYSHFEGRVHEQIVSMEGTAVPTFQTTMIIDHRGYDLDSKAKEKKTERNLKLLFAELEEHPGDTYLLYQIGKSYYFVEDYPNSADYFCQALGTEWNPADEYTMDMLTCLGYALVNCGIPDAALDLQTYWQYYKDSADYTYMMAYVYMQNGRFQEAIDTFLRATTCSKVNVIGTNTYLAHYNAGVILECLGRTKEAEEQYQKSASYGYQPGK